MRNNYSLSALRREIECDLRGLEIPADLRLKPIRTASRCDACEPDESLLIPVSYDARITDHVAHDGGDPWADCFRRFVVALAALAAILFVLALIFPEAWF